VVTTRAYRYHLEDAVEVANDIFKASVLVYAKSTWCTHSPYFQKFQDFCLVREVNPFDCTPSLINIFLLQQAQAGSTYGVIHSTLTALSFMYKFYMARDFTADQSVLDMKKFLEKICPKRNNQKSAFGSVQIRKIWDDIEKSGGIEKLSILELRTFMMSVFQHATFCRFSETANVTVADVVHDIDFFQIYIRYSKTDQAGTGSFAYLPKRSSAYRDPHMLLCLYVQKMGFDKDDTVTQYLFPPLV